MLLFLTMNNNLYTDFSCNSSAPYNISTFPSITSRNSFNFQSFSEQISAIEETAVDQEILLSQAPLPTVDSVVQAERELYSSFGDKRFNGASAYDFIFTRYKAIDTINNGSAVLTAVACDYDGYPYTYYIPNTATYYDSNNKSVKLPIYDSRGRQVKFPLKDTNGKFLLTSAITAIDSKDELIVFPLKDIDGAVITFPFKGATGDIIITPPPNQDQLLNVQEAYNSLDVAYSYAKDLHSAEFAEYIVSIEKNQQGKVGFFYSDLDVPAQSATIAVFAAAIYSVTATSIDLVDITSLNINTLIRYYPDRADLTYKHYKDLGGVGPYTIIIPSSSKNIKALIKNENTKLACYGILSSPFWSLEIPQEQYYNNSLGSATHTSILEIIDKTDNNTSLISNLQSQINTLSSTVNDLSTQLINLSTQYLATSALVRYNTNIIDTIVVPTVWINIWSPTAGFVAPGVPAAR